MRQFRARPAALPVAAPVELLNVVEEGGGALDVPGNGARLHIRDALPGFGVVAEVILVGAFGLHQRAFAAVGPQPGIDGEDHAIACIGADDVDQALGNAGPEKSFSRRRRRG